MAPAQANSRSSTGKAIHVLSLFSLLLLIQKSNAYQFKVGGSGTWSPPSDPNSNSYNQWAEKSRFQIGDTLLFLYSGDADSVLLVNKDNYNNCNTDNPIQKFTDGSSEIKFEHSGPHYFISGVKDHCLKNEKLLVVVMADRRSSASPPPTSTSPPSPAPSGEEAPSPPAGSSVDINPTPAPSAQSKPKKNGASSNIVKSFIAPMGALLGSCLLMVF